MDLEKMLKETRKLVESVTAELNLPFLQKQLRDMPVLFEQLEQLGKQVAEFLDSLLPVGAELIKEIEQIEGKIRLDLNDLLKTLQVGDRYLPAIQIIISLFIRTRIFLYNASSLPEEERRLKEAELHQKNAEELCALCKEQGGAWVKAAQFLSCRSDWLPSAYIDAFSSLQDQSLSVPWSQIQRILEEEFGQQWKTRFEFIEETPVATASIAQVHKAQLQDGTLVALKVQLPDAPEKIKADLKFFKLVARLHGKYIKGLDLEQIIRELSDSILLELDYYQEAANLTLFLSHHRDAQWKFPGLIEELLTSRTLGMDFIEGVPLRQFLHDVPSAAESVLKQLVASFTRQVFITGTFHADPHPGNFFVTPKGEIALLDFGVIGRLTAEESANYRHILMILLMKDKHSLEHALLKAGFVIPDIDLLAEALFNNTNDHQALLQLKHYLHIMGESKVVMPDNFILMARVLFTIGGLLHEHKVPLGWQDLAAALQ